MFGFIVFVFVFEILLFLKLSFSFFEYQIYYFFSELLSLIHFGDYFILVKNSRVRFSMKSRFVNFWGPCRSSGSKMSSWRGTEVVVLCSFEINREVWRKWTFSSIKPWTKSNLQIITRLISENKIFCLNFLLLFHSIYLPVKFAAWVMTELLSYPVGFALGKLMYRSV